MASITPVDKLLTTQKSTQGVKSLSATSVDSLFTSGANASQANADAQARLAIADKEQADVTNAYLVGANQAAGFNSDILKKQGEQNQKLAEAVHAASQKIIDADNLMNDPNAGFLDRIGAMFTSSSARQTAQRLAGVQALENQQTVNLVNLSQAVTASTTLKAQETTEAQRQAKADAGIANAQFNNSQELVKLKSQQLSISQQAQQAALTAQEIESSKMRMTALAMELKDRKDNKQEIANTVQSWNDKYGTALTPEAFNMLPDAQKVLMIQNHAGAMPVTDPVTTVQTMNAMGVPNNLIEKGSPGILAMANNYAAASQKVDNSNAALGARPTKEQRDAQIATEVQSTYKQSDNTIISAGLDDAETNPSSIWKDVPKGTMDAIKKVVLPNADAMTGMGMDAQFQFTAEKLYQADDTQSAQQLASKLVSLSDTLNKGATKQLQSQGISNQGFAMEVTVSEPGLFGEAKKKLSLSTPADYLNYAAQLVKQKRQRIIEKGTLDAQMGAYGRLPTSGNKTQYQKSLETNSDDRTKTDMTR